MNKGRGYKVMIICICIMLSVVAIISNHYQYRDGKANLSLEEIFDKEQ